MKHRRACVPSAMAVALIGAGLSAAAAPVQITFATWAFSGANANAINSSIAQFEQLHPDIDVNVEQVPCCNAVTLQKYLVQIAGGAGPDIMQVPYTEFSAMARSGSLLALDRYIATDAATVKPDDVFPPAWTAVTYAGKRYGMPFDLSAQWMAFMPEHFVEAGIQDPISAYKQGAWTWETLRRDAKKLTLRNASGDLQQIGLLFQHNELLGQPWLYQTGTTPFTKDLSAARLNDPRIVQSVEFLDEMLNQDQSMLQAWSQPVADPKQGHFGIWPQWLSIPYYFKGSSIKTNIVPAVEGPVGHVDTGQIHAIAIWADTKHPQAAWEFAAFLTGTRGYRSMIDIGLGPIRKSLVPYYLSTVSGRLGDTGAKLFLDDVGRLRLFQVTPNWDQVSDAIVKGLDPVWAGKRPAKTALAEIQQTVTALLNAPKSQAGTDSGQP